MDDQLHLVSGGEYREARRREAQRGRSEVPKDAATSGRERYNLNDQTRILKINRTACG
ncbi:hypothetical protein [Streptomyces sp. NPDC048106]|uniref:hypothetical protein n=1 Tax=Streptomyces sp. NPDC048106 TaxID=3155750 RepID=UPI0034571B37